MNPSSLDENSLGINFNVLNDGMSKRMDSSPIGNSRGQSKNSSSSNSNNNSSNNNGNINSSSSNLDRSTQRNGNRTNGTGTIKTTTSSSYDTAIRMPSNSDMAIEGLRENVSSNNVSSASFRYKFKSFNHINNLTIMLISNDLICSDYPPITSVEQRRKYKTEFDKDYAEYRQLHTVMEKARKRFADLQTELRKVQSDERKYMVNIIA
jgi:hypothetical protein